MGGCGSGRHNGAKKRQVESCLALDVNELCRLAALTDGAAGTLTWECDGTPVAPAVFHAESAAVTFAVEPAAESRRIEPRLLLASVPAAFGGSRAYFLCPGAGCNRRVARLYFAKGVFRCRRCHRPLIGVSAKIGLGECGDVPRSCEAALATRCHSLAPSATRPKGMWRRTFDRLQRAALRVEIATTTAESAAWWRLLARVEKRRFRKMRVAESGKIHVAHDCP